MKKQNIEQIQTQLVDLFDKQLKDRKDYSGVSIVLNKDDIGVCTSGDPKDIFTLFSMFLIECPVFIHLIENAVECAKDFHNQQPIENGFGVVGEA